MALGRKGGPVVVLGGNGGGGEKLAEEFSSSRIEVREALFNHGGGRIFARRWRLSRRASQSGRSLRYGGWREFIGPLNALKFISRDDHEPLSIALAQLSEEERHTTIPWLVGRRFNSPQVNLTSRVFDGEPPSPFPFHKEKQPPKGLGLEAVSRPSEQGRFQPRARIGKISMKP